jgi:hypothetical protein
LLSNLLGPCVVIAMIATIICLVAGSYYLVQANLNRAPSPPYRWLVKCFGLNVVLFPDQLSPAGLRYRSKYFVWLIATLGMITVMIVFLVALALS